MQLSHRITRVNMSRSPKDTRQQLLAEARRQFCQSGYYGTDSNRIAKEAGFSPQTFYRHFSDKRAIFLDVYDDFATAVTARLAAGSSARQLVRAIVALHKEWGAFRSSLIALHATDETVREIRLQKQRAQLEELSRKLDIERSDALFLLWACERMADGVALGEAKAMKVSEAALVERFAALFDARWDSEPELESRPSEAGT